MIVTNNGVINCPDFFPTIGWPAGRGEYDRLFQNLDYFCDKLDHKHFLFNFSSFAFGFTIPKNDFQNQFENMKNYSIKEILKNNTSIDSKTADDLIILLDVGGNRIFNKVVSDSKDVKSINSYDIYTNAYRDFVSKSNADIFVNFDIGPSYSTRDEISKKGVKIWESLDNKVKKELNKNLLDLSIDMKEDNLIMVPISGVNEKDFEENLNYLYDTYEDNIDIIGIAGIANKGPDHLIKILSIFSKFKEHKSWDVKSHGLGLGGWQKIPYLVNYGVDTCDVATPWRRACTDSVSQVYIPLIDEEGNFMNNSDPFSYNPINSPMYDDLTCNCPFCNDLPLVDIKRIYQNSDKRNTGNSNHLDDYYQMRVRIFFHNVFQHKSLLKKMHEYKEDYGSDFISKFSKDLPEGKMKSALNKNSL
ncbi:hypothetical protein [Methanolobus psychrotolerans]|uniref:hypothetical protein n=1 Tax=Methanolobus psychrotolerans TaxID=1874706 RepID=UPI000B917C4F|nr:hypothetical protein [Methanolobus psychrotolerans]